MPLLSIACCFSTARMGAVLGCLASGVMALAVGCGGREPRPEAHRGPIVLITVDTLRADAVGALGGPTGLTPHLDALASESVWAQPAVATSSWTVPSMASILTGKQPWRTGNWHAERAKLHERHVTMPEMLRDVGFATQAFTSNTWLRGKFGYAQGVDEFRRLGGGRRARAALAALDGSAQFVWVHVLPPHAPYQRHADYLDRVAGATIESLPQRVTPADLEPYYDPAVTLPEEQRRVFWQMYQLHVAHSDAVVGGLLQSIKDSGHWEDALIVVTSDHGEEFGEAGQIAHGGNLHRVLLEVPLLIKLPANSKARLRPRTHVSNARVFATVADLVGASRESGEHGAAAPTAARDGVQPSLLDPEASDAALSELYLGNGINSFSLVRAGEQTVVTSTFSPPSPDYFAVRRRQLIEGDPQLRAIADSLGAAQREAFLTTAPLAGGGEPAIEVFRWGVGRGDVVERMPVERRLARELREAWLAANGADVAPAELGDDSTVPLTPEEIEELRSLGYLAGG